MLRGGSWNNNRTNLRSANRNRNTPDNRNNNNGFRLASTTASRAVSSTMVRVCKRVRPGAWGEPRSPRSPWLAAWPAAGVVFIFKLIVSPLRSASVRLRRWQQGGAARQLRLRPSGDPRPRRLQAALRLRSAQCVSLRPTEPTLAPYPMNDPACN